MGNLEPPSVEIVDWVCYCVRNTGLLSGQKVHLTIEVSYELQPTITSTQKTCSGVS